MLVTNLSHSSRTELGKYATSNCQTMEKFHGALVSWHQCVQYELFLRFLIFRLDLEVLEEAGIAVARGYQ